ncbi:MAG: hypothetical protein J0H36_08520, partial [Hyphomicrobium denitrificans]|nr:hypothetical protein [Hyphomicrobium denitrificans]
RIIASCRIQQKRVQRKIPSLLSKSRPDAGDACDNRALERAAHGCCFVSNVARKLGSPIMRL